MTEQKNITINGVHYDKESGRPVSQAAQQNARATTTRSSQNAQAMHRRQAKSIALNRAFVAKQKKATQVRPPAAARSKLVTPGAIARSPHISRFAKEPKMVAAPIVKDIAPIPHPVVKRAEKIHRTRTAPAVTAAPVAPVQQKNSAIEQALNAAKPSAKDHRASKKRSRFFSIAGSSLAIVLLAGYFTYINMPNLSVRVAAAQAGIDARYPEYRPIGYQLNGPVAYSDDSKQVSMNFTSNSSPQSFTLNQTKSSWDSSALLEKHVDPSSRGDYATYSDGGLTIYTYGSKAAWVNSGILYTVEGTANLSNDQIRHMATSL